MRRRALTTIVQVAGLGGTACIVWMLSVRPRLRFQSAESVVVDALGYALLALLWSGLLVFVMWVILGRSSRADAFALAVRTARTGVWLAPASILLSHLSPAAVIPALALVVGATQMLYSQWTTGALPVMREPAGMFELLARPPMVRALGPALAAALGPQLGFVAVMLGFPLLAAFLFSATAAMVTLLLLSAGLLPSEQTQKLPQSAMGIVLTLLLAAGLTTIHGLYWYRHGIRGVPGGDPGLGTPRGPLESARELMRKLSEQKSGGNDDVEDSATRLYNAPPGTVDIVDTVFPGVVLTPEIRPYASIVAPMPSWTAGSQKAIESEPYSIPFSGEYWMFKPPYSRPPRNAYVQRGTPLNMFYRTTDHRNMSMEAHQRLEHPIRADCCRAIRIAVMNVDEYPGTISLELALADSRAKPPVSVSLGRVKLKSYPVSRAPVSEFVGFPVPAGLRREFNELQVVMHRDPVRGDKSARLSIERFLLVPRSL